MPNMRTRERVLGTMAVLGSFIGGTGLILLSIFDTKRFSTLHRLFLLIFMIGVALSAIFTIAEVCWGSLDAVAVLLTFALTSIAGSAKTFVVCEN